MDKIAMARALHVAAVIVWIGGVAFVTTVLLPATRRFRSPDERLAFFDAVERRFAWQARFSTLLAGATGLYMVVELDLWGRFQSLDYWWMHGMVAVWAIFTLMLFVAEPLFLHQCNMNLSLAANAVLISGLRWISEGGRSRIS